MRVTLIYLAVVFLLTTDDVSEHSCPTDADAVQPVERGEVECAVKSERRSDAFTDTLTASTPDEASNQNAESSEQDAEVKVEVLSDQNEAEDSDSSLCDNSPEVSTKSVAPKWQVVLKNYSPGAKKIKSRKRSRTPENKNTSGTEASDSLSIPSAMKKDASKTPEKSVRWSDLTLPDSVQKYCDRNSSMVSPGDNSEQKSWKILQKTGTDSKFLTNSSHRSTKSANRASSKIKPKLLHRNFLVNRPTSGIARWLCQIMLNQRTNLKAKSYR